jgi:hypothetical protein
MDAQVEYNRTNEEIKKGEDVEIFPLFLWVGLT